MSFLRRRAASPPAEENPTSPSRCRRSSGTNSPGRTSPTSGISGFCARIVLMVSEHRNQEIVTVTEESPTTRRAILRVDKAVYDTLDLTQEQRIADAEWDSQNPTSEETLVEHQRHLAHFAIPRTHTNGPRVVAPSNEVVVPRSCSTSPRSGSIIQRPELRRYSSHVALPNCFSDIAH